MPPDRSVPLVCVRRGGREESLHRGAIALWEGARLRAVLAWLRLDAELGRRQSPHQSRHTMRLTLERKPDKWLPAPD